MSSTVQDDFSAFVLQCSPDCVKLLDEDGNVLFFNKNGLCAMEIDNFDQVSGKFWPTLWPDETRVLAEKALHDARELGSAEFEGFCPTAKGKPRWWQVNLSQLPSDRGAKQRFVVISRDVTEQRRLRELERENHDRLATILGAGSSVLWDIDLKADRVWWSEGMQSTFGYGPEQVGEGTRWCHDHIHPEDRDRVVEGMKRAIDDGRTLWQDEFRYLKADGTYARVADRGSIVRDAAGQAVRFLGSMEDVSKQRASENRQDLLSRELAHRINNTLAIVLGLMHQTRAKATSLEDFTADFSARVLALSNANTTLVRSKWDGVHLRELAATQLGPYSADDRVTMQGPDVILPLEVAQPMALALHELATNALKYGSLSNGSGQVDLRWTTTVQDGVRIAKIKWREVGGPAPRPNGRKGLGSVLIEQGIPGATVERELASDGLQCSIEVPLTVLLCDRP